MNSLVGTFAEELVDFISYYFGWLLNLFKDILDLILDTLGIILTYPGPALFILVLIGISILITKRLILPIFIGIAFYVIYWMGYWDSSMVTLNMVL